MVLIHGCVILFICCVPFRYNKCKHINFLTIYYFKDTQMMDILLLERQPIQAVYTKEGPLRHFVVFSR